MCKKFKFDQMLYAQPDSILENETHKILWDFEKQTDNLISTRRPDHVITKQNNNKTEILPNCELCRPGVQRVKIKEKEER